MPDTIATIIMTSPKFCVDHEVGPGAEQYMLEQGVSLGNSGNDIWEILGAGDFKIPDNAKLIADMFAYSPSRGRWPETYAGLCEFNDTEQIIFDRTYLYDCGDGAYLGTDEPGSRGDKAYRAFDYARGYQRVYDALVDYSGLKPVVTHPRVPQMGLLTDGEGAGKCRAFSDFGTDIVHCYDTHAIEAAVQKHEPPKDPQSPGGFRQVLDIPEDAEVWAYNALYERCAICKYLSVGATKCANAHSVKYGFNVTGDDKCDLFKPSEHADPYRADWMTEETPTPCNRPGDMGTWLRERGIAAYLHNTRLTYLVHKDATDPRKLLNDNGKSLIGGMNGG